MWILRAFAGLMLVVAAISATRVTVAGLTPNRLSLAEPRPSLLVSAAADNEIAYVLMGIAMAGMLVAGLTTLPTHNWETIFGVLTVWFAWRVVRDTRVNGVRFLARRHSTLHVFQCAAMVYLFAAVTTSGDMDMTGMGMGGSMARSLDRPALALVFASVFVCYAVWDLARPPKRRARGGLAPSATRGDVGPVAVATTATARALLLSPAVTAAGGIAMNVTMAFMLFAMI